ncbi:MAG: response regulator [Symploca sp. SIO2B6]|nr:response regulator [Symploca sp. SIO2B6]
MVSHKILVIDDSRVIRGMVRDMLPKGNFEVLEAKDGIEGLDSIQKQSPNLIMLDFLLPKLSGWEVFQAIQNNTQYQKIPLVLMSGRKEEVAEKIKEPFQYFEFIEKPFEQKELINAIKGAMKKAKDRPVSATPETSTAASVAATSSNGTASGASAEEVQALKQQIEKMQTELDLVKKQMAQILAFIKQKLK